MKMMIIVQTAGRVNILNFAERLLLLFAMLLLLCNTACRGETERDSTTDVRWSVDAVRVIEPQHLDTLLNDPQASDKVEPVSNLEGSRTWVSAEARFEAQGGTRPSTSGRFRMVVEMEWQHHTSAHAGDTQGERRICMFARNKRVSFAGAGDCKRIVVPPTDTPPAAKSLMQPVEHRSAISFQVGAGYPGVVELVAYVVLLDKDEFFASSDTEAKGRYPDFFFPDRPEVEVMSEWINVLVHPQKYSTLVPLPRGRQTDNIELHDLWARKKASRHVLDMLELSPGRYNVAHLFAAGLARANLCERAVRDNSRVVLFMANGPHLPMVVNAVRSLRAVLVESTSIVLIALDQEVAGSDAFASLAVHIVFVTDLVDVCPGCGQGRDVYSDGFPDLVMLKAVAVRTMLECASTVMWSDSDLVFFADPFLHFPFEHVQVGRTYVDDADNASSVLFSMAKLRGPGDDRLAVERAPRMDIVVQAGSVDGYELPTTKAQLLRMDLCTGLYLVRSSARTKLFFEHVATEMLRKARARSRRFGDQAAFNLVLHEAPFRLPASGFSRSSQASASNAAVAVAAIDPYLAPSGNMFLDDLDRNNINNVGESDGRGQDGQTGTPKPVRYDPFPKLRLLPVAVHNNFLIGRERKVSRFQRTRLWMQHLRPLESSAPLPVAARRPTASTATSDGTLQFNAHGFGGLSALPLPCAAACRSVGTARSHTETATAKYLHEVLRPWVDENVLLRHRASAPVGDDGGQYQTRRIIVVVSVGPRPWFVHTAPSVVQYACDTAADVLLVRNVSCSLPPREAPPNTEADGGPGQEAHSQDPNPTSKGLVEELFSVGIEGELARQDDTVRWLLCGRKAKLLATHWALSHYDRVLLVDDSVIIRPGDTPDVFSSTPRDSMAATVETWRPEQERRKLLAEARGMYLPWSADIVESTATEPAWFNTGFVVLPQAALDPFCTFLRQSLSATRGLNSSGPSNTEEGTCFDNLSRTRLRFEVFHDQGLLNAFAQWFGVQQQQQQQQQHPGGSIVVDLGVQMNYVASFLGRNRDAAPFPPEDANVVHATSYLGMQSRVLFLAHVWRRWHRGEFAAAAARSDNCTLRISPTTFVPVTHHPADQLLKAGANR